MSKIISAHDSVEWEVKISRFFSSSNVQILCELLALNNMCLTIIPFSIKYLFPTYAWIGINAINHHYMPTTGSISGSPANIAWHMR